MLDCLKRWKTKMDGPPLASGPNHVPVRVDISCRSGVQERSFGWRGRHSSIKDNFSSVELVSNQDRRCTNQSSAVSFQNMPRLREDS